MSIFLILIFAFFSQQISAMLPAQPQPSPRKIPSLKELCFRFGIQTYGQGFIKSFESVSKKPIKANEDIIFQATQYYESGLKIIDSMIGEKYPRNLIHPPAAPLLNKVIKILFKEGRFDLLQIINEHYYASLKWPAITIMATGNKLESLRILRWAGASKNTQDFLGRTPLICACRNGHLDIVKYLLSRDADIFHKDKCNSDAEKHAKQFNRTEILRLLHEKKASLNTKK